MVNVIDANLARWVALETRRAQSIYQGALVGSSTQTKLTELHAAILGAGILRLTSQDVGVLLRYEAGVCERDPGGNLAQWLNQILASPRGRMTYEAYLGLRLVGDFSMPGGALWTAYGLARRLRGELLVRRGAARIAAARKRDVDLLYVALEELVFGDNIVMPEGIDGEFWRRLSVVPFTSKDDEILFIRITQICEVLYREVAWWLDRASAEAPTDGNAACQSIERAVTRLTILRNALQSLRTLQMGEFEQIRAATYGASALQSRGFANAIEAGLRLSESVVDQSYDGIFYAVGRLELAWRRINLMHMGLAVRLVKQRPGTGGTSGVTYLADRVSLRLVPNIPVLGLQEGV